jgi:hypothetical protein
MRRQAAQVRRRAAWCGLVRRCAECGIPHKCPDLRRCVAYLHTPQISGTCCGV